jgi:hypothetical protein
MAATFFRITDMTRSSMLKLEAMLAAQTAAAAAPAAPSAAPAAAPVPAPDPVPQAVPAPDPVPCARAPAVIVHVPRASTAHASMLSFLKVAQDIQVGCASDSDAALAPPACAVTMGGVGLRVQGRASQFDLWYFFATRMFYCVDARDDSFVASMPSPIDIAAVAVASGSRTPRTH